MKRGPATGPREFSPPPSRSNYCEQDTAQPLNLADAAQRYASHRWAVFPAYPGTNRPRITEWPDKATTDGAQVRTWWTIWPDANICHVPGRSGHVVIDLDGPEGFESWRQLQRLHGRAPATLMSRSPRVDGGVHLHFQRPDGFYIASTASKLAPKVDVRGDRGQAVLPPSRRPDGCYRWVDPSVPIAQPPAWLVALLRPHPVLRSVKTVRGGVGRWDARLGGLVRTVRGAQEGTLNCTLYWAACRVRDANLEGQVPDVVGAASELVEAAVAAGHPRRGAAATVASALPDCRGRAA